RGTLVSNACLICLSTTTRNERYHARCLKDLFGKPKLPEIDVEVAKLHTVALAMVGQTTLSGIQRKISLSLVVERPTLRLEVGAGSYILKPQTQTYPQLPENEHVTMAIARAAGIEVPPNGLLELKDGTLAYIVKRFDRDTNVKHRQE